MIPPLAVTVTAKHPGRYDEPARAKARAWGLPFVPRIHKAPIEPMLGRDAQAFFILGGDGWTLTDAAGSLWFSPGMARVRIKRLRDGVQQPDQLVRLCELGPGDSVLDCTLGLGADALVCAHIVGPTGRVIGLEGSRALSALAEAGLAAMGANIEVHHVAALDFLSQQPSHSVDCVVFDPMFDKPKRSSPAFDVLRRYAVHTPLDLQTLNEARRVAKRWVVVKSGRFGDDFASLGLEALVLTRFSPLVWARVAPLP